MTTDAPDMLAAALEARKVGPIFPLHDLSGGVCSCGKADCGTRAGKHPRTEHGLKDATQDENTIREWWTRWPQANIGLLTGAVSGVIVLDIDPRHGGDKTIEALQKQFGDLPLTWSVKTGGGGWHLYFKHPGGRIGNSAGKIGEGIDLRGDGGYIVFPPSRTADKPHRWTKGNAPAVLSGEGVSHE